MCDEDDAQLSVMGGSSEGRWNCGMVEVPQAPGLTLVRGPAMRPVTRGLMGVPCRQGVGCGRSIY